jgi:hypothetical protein
MNAGVGKRCCKNVYEEDLGLFFSTSHFDYSLEHHLAEAIATKSKRCFLEALEK